MKTVIDTTKQEGVVVRRKRGLDPETRIRMLSSKGLTNSAINLRNEMRHLLKIDGKRHMVKKKRISDATYSLRYRFVTCLAADLYELGHPVKFTRNIGRKHCIALCKHWESILGPSALAEKKTLLRLVLSWVGKTDALDDIPIKELFVNPKATYRQSKTQFDKSTSGALKRALEIDHVDIDKAMLWETCPLAKINSLWALCDQMSVTKRKNPRLFITMLELMYWFGLRAGEAAFFRPEKDMFLTRYKGKELDGEYILVHKSGAKSGRERLVKIHTNEQRLYLRQLRERLYCRKKIMPSDVKKLSTWKRRFYEFCVENGFSKENGTHPHSLRHEYAQRRYEAESGLTSPIRSKGDVKVDNVAKKTVARELGHNRPSITGAYTG